MQHVPFHLEDALRVGVAAPRGKPAVEARQRRVEQRLPGRLAEVDGRRWWTGVRSPRIGRRWWTGVRSPRIGRRWWTGVWSPGIVHGTRIRGRPCVGRSRVPVPGVGGLTAGIQCSCVLSARIGLRRNANATCVSWPIAGRHPTRAGHEGAPDPEAHEQDAHGCHREIRIVGTSANGGCGRSHARYALSDRPPSGCAGAAERRSAALADRCDQPEPDGHEQALAQAQSLQLPNAEEETRARITGVHPVRQVAVEIGAPLLDAELEGAT